MSSSADAQARFEIADDIGVITLNRPRQLNAMTPEMVAEIVTALDQAESRAVRALLVQAEGRGFCAGRDLQGSRPGEEDGGEVLDTLFHPMVRRVAALTMPTVAAVQGACLGTGLGLALACDIILAAQDAKIGSPFGKIGAVLDSGGHKAFLDRLGSAVAFDLIYTGRFLSGTEAAERGLVSRAVPAQELSEVAHSTVATLAQGPTLAFAESKRILRVLSEESVSLGRTLDLEAQAQSRSSATKDYVEGFTAFLEGRDPIFTKE